MVAAGYGDGSAGLSRGAVLCAWPVGRNSMNTHALKLC